MAAIVTGASNDCHHVPVTSRVEVCIIKFKMSLWWKCKQSVTSSYFSFWNCELMMFDVFTEDIFTNYSAQLRCNWLCCTNWILSINLIAFAYLLDVSSDIRAGDKSLFVDVGLAFEHFNERFCWQYRWLSWWRWWNIFQHRYVIDATTVIWWLTWNENHEIRFDLLHKSFDDTEGDQTKMFLLFTARCECHTKRGLCVSIKMLAGLFFTVV